jgi:hypothetical protein
MAGLGQSEMNAQSNLQACLATAPTAGDHFEALLAIVQGEAEWRRMLRSLGITPGCLSV